MVLPDYAKIQNLILAYPERFYNEYERLTLFYDSLIELIPNNYQIWLIANTNATCNKLKSKYPHKKLNVLCIKQWDEIWLRDCIGFNSTEGVIKPYYHPKYCSLSKYSDYFAQLNTKSRVIIKECLVKKVIEMPLVLDGGNFSSNHSNCFITDKILEDNQNLSKSEICRIINDFTGLQPEIISRSSTDAIGHTDGFLQFLTNDKVLLANYPSLPFLKPDIDFIYSVRKILEKEKLEIVDLFDRPVDEIVPCECYRKTKKACFYSARGNYINLLRLNNTIILPEYTLPTYRESKYYNAINKEVLANMGYEVKTINCDQLSREGGSLHCLSYTF